MSGGDGSVIAAALATASGSAGLWWLLRDWLRNRRERGRFSDVTHLIDKVGTDKIEEIAHLAHVLITDSRTSTRPTLSASRRDDPVDDVGAVDAGGSSKRRGRRR
ncbi:hypothetical protein O7634_12530 [Micromonospora sp. WMMD1120]|uniref:hypothetical protein n=1 Tax=Micromonospora sp. WMMD1120 TaxID=3016106 RepID=UPI002417A495|nr:hypothetical protein [Micromonospora sp. WMMD1120]MDG4807578.1 hypothetical protein [Micromonospora sp. WMMD1120]